MARHWIIIIWGAAVAAVVAASLVPELAPPGQYQLDKLIHAAVYMTLTAIPALLFRRLQPVLLIGLALAVMGYGVEMAQAQIPGRMGSDTDAVMNLVGVFAGLTLGWVLRRRFFNSQLRRAGANLQR